jgi:PAS domain S-box-containing protein
MTNQTESNSQNSDARFRSVLENISLIGVMLDGHGSITFCNDYLLNLAGWQRDEVIGKNWFETFLPPEIREHIYHDVFLPTIESGDFPPGYTNEIITRSGELRTVAWSNTVFRDEENILTGITSIGQDITEQRRAEEALQISEERMRQALIGTDQGAWEWHLETGHMYYDDSLSAILGYPPEVIATINEAWWFDVNTPESLEASRTAMRDYFAGRKPHYELEFQAMSADKEWRWLWVRGASIERDANGKVLRLAGTFRDVTERRRLEEAMRAVQKMASLGTLAAGVAHEINSPLQVITGLCNRHLGALEKQQLDIKGLNNDLTVMNRNAWRIAEIVRSLLVFARPSVDQVAPNSLPNIIDDTLLLIEHKLRSWQNITIAKDYPDDLPLFVCDHNGISQVLINLLTNAADAMPSGGTITLHARHDQKLEALVLKVIDTGIGIPTDLYLKIFEPFYTTKEIGSGTGLGLSIAQSIIEAHGGAIQIDSVPNLGTTIILTLPLKQPSGTQQPHADLPPNRFGP